MASNKGFLLEVPYVYPVHELVPDINEENDFIQYSVNDPKMKHDGKCHWFKLPIELQTKIYHLAAGAAKPRWVNPITRKKAYMPPLLLTCKRNLFNLVKQLLWALESAKEQRRSDWETASELAFWCELDEPVDFEEDGNMNADYGKWCEKYTKLEAAEQAAKAEQLRAKWLWLKQVELMISLGLDIEITE